METLKQTFRNIGQLWNTVPCPSCETGTVDCYLCGGDQIVSREEANDYKNRKTERDVNVMKEALELT